MAACALIAIALLGIGGLVDCAAVPKPINGAARAEELGGAGAFSQKSGMHPEAKSIEKAGAAAEVDAFVTGAIREAQDEASEQELTAGLAVAVQNRRGFIRRCKNTGVRGSLCRENWRRANVLCICLWEAAGTWLSIFAA